MVSKSHKQQQQQQHQQQQQPITIAIAEEECLRTASRLERAEVLRRRSRRLHQLASVYRRLYWCLLEELRAKHRDYYWHYGKSPTEIETAAASVDKEETDNTLMRPKCAFSGCKSKAMPLTTFCHSHILADPKQTLYKPCIFQLKCSPQGAPIICAKPVLKAADPSLCHAHYQRSHKAMSQALKKAGLPSSSSNKPLPKFSLLISQAVRHVQMKRRSQSQSQSESQSANCSKDDKTQEEQDLG